MVKVKQLGSPKQMAFSDCETHNILEKYDSYKTRDFVDFVPDRNEI